MATNHERQEIIDIVKKSGVGVLLTDTIYGLVGRALNPETVERIYLLKERDPEKPMIILISSLDDLAIFKVRLDDRIRQVLSKIWPGKVSVILPCPASEFKYLHRGTGTLAFRLPKNKKLVSLIRETGPLIAPSANPERLKPAETIEEARNYFGDQVDFYLDEGRRDGLPSTLVELKDGKLLVKRKGGTNVRIENSGTGT